MKYISSICTIVFIILLVYFYVKTTNKNLNRKSKDGIIVVVFSTILIKLLSLFPEKFIINLIQIILFCIMFFGIYKFYKYINLEKLNRKLKDIYLLISLTLSLKIFLAIISTIVLVFKIISI